MYTGLSITPVYPWVEQRRRNNAVQVSREGRILGERRNTDESKAYSGVGVLRNHGYNSRVNVNLAECCTTDIVDTCRSCCLSKHWPGKRDGFRRFASECRAETVDARSRSARLSAVVIRPA